MSNSKFPFREGRKDGRGYRSGFKFSVVTKSGRKKKARDVTKRDITNWGGAYRWAKEEYGDEFEAVLTGHYAQEFNASAPRNQDEIINRTKLNV